VDPLIVRNGVVIPAEAMAMQAVRSGGPGGQNVNKVSSKVELRIDVSRVVGLSGAARARLRAGVGARWDAEGRLVVVSQRTRDQRANLDDAREKARELVLAALVEPKRRRPTKPTRGSVERRIAQKKQQASRKAGRRAGPDD
jgi:ribosome-associated protein